MNTFSERELSQLRLNYSRGQDLLCPRCGEILEEKLQSGGGVSRSSTWWTDLHPPYRKM